MSGGGAGRGEEEEGGRLLQEEGGEEEQEEGRGRGREELPSRRGRHRGVRRGGCVRVPVEGKRRGRVGCGWVDACGWDSGWTATVALAYPHTLPFFPPSQSSLHAQAALHPLNSTLVTTTRHSRNACPQATSHTSCDLQAHTFIHILTQALTSCPPPHTARASTPKQQHTAMASQPPQPKCPVCKKPATPAHTCPSCLSRAYARRPAWRAASVSTGAKNAPGWPSRRSTSDTRPSSGCATT